MPHKIQAKTLFFLFLLFFFSPYIVSISPQKKRAKQIWFTNIEKGLRSARQKKRPIIIDFYASWCDFCRRLRREVYPNPKVMAQTRNFVRVRINGENQPRIMKRYQVDSFPTTIFLDKNGALLDRMTGFVIATKMIQKLKEARKDSNHYKIIIAKTKKNPHDLYWNYEAGSYYFSISFHKQAHHYFLNAWKKNKTKSLNSKKDIEKRRRSLYNAAVSSMHMDQYQTAVLEWGIYLKNYPKKNKEYTNARYYRGLSYFYQNKKKSARNDLYYAEKNLKNQEASYTAQILLKTIPK